MLGKREQSLFDVTGIFFLERSGHWQLALYTLKLLPLAGFQPDLVTYGSVMNALAAGGALKIHGFISACSILEI